MELVTLIIIAAILVVIVLLFVQFKSLSFRQHLSSDQTMQLFTVFKSDVESAVKSVADTTRSNSESLASTLQLVSNSLSKGMDENRAGTNSQVNQLAGQMSQLTTIVGKQVEQLTTSVDQRLGQSMAATDKQISQLAQQISELSRIVGGQVEELRGSVEKRLSSFEGQLGGQLSEANKLFSSLKQDFGELKESSNNMLQIGKQINELQNILSSPKLRGNLGETLLEELIKQVIPQGFYEFQYTFKDGSKVDAIIRTSERIIPIDSKFPKDEFERYVNAETEAEKNGALARFSKVVKTQIDDIAEKYIRPAENTFDFAIMFIPSESMYYELLMQDNDENGAYRHAMKKHVVPASPNSFYAYIQAIAIGLKGMQIEKNAERVRDQLAQLENSLVKFSDHFDTLGTHLRNAANKYGDSHEALGRFKERLQGIAKIDDEQPKIE
ncbi:MAG: DNA recombination protein RmuC [Bacteroidetes bacterium]|nr:DNA recombination protein RmuC [Bacteroidota bacterium]